MLKDEAYLKLLDTIERNTKIMVISTLVALAGIAVTLASVFV
ncbi:hypothetical protein [Vibrio sp. SCSIO 43132]|nr:hypothetical protein [Vibrio sp. SCSIO 43132]